MADGPARRRRPGRRSADGTGVPIDPRAAAGRHRHARPDGGRRAPDHRPRRGHRGLRRGRARQAVAVRDRARVQPPPGHAATDRARRAPTRSPRSGSTARTRRAGGSSAGRSGRAASSARGGAWSRWPRPTTPLNPAIPVDPDQPGDRRARLLRAVGRPGAATGRRRGPDLVGPERRERRRASVQQVEPGVGQRDPPAAARGPVRSRRRRAAARPVPLARGHLRLRARGPGLRALVGGADPRRAAGRARLERPAPEPASPVP